MQTKFHRIQDFFDDDIDLLTEIGCGTFSTVKLCHHKDYPEKKYAMKIQKIESQLDLYYLKQEIELHKQLQHQNIIGFEGFIQDEKKFYIFLEYSDNNDLFEYIYNKDLTENQKIEIFRQICLGVQECHKKDIIHRDLKPENILLNKNFVPKICDFGWSCKNDQIQQLQSSCGTVDYNCPEIFNHKLQSKAIDIWALGIILYELYHQKLPFKYSKKMKFKKQIKKIKFKKNIPLELKELIQKMLSINPKERPTIKEVLQHRFIQKTKNPCDYIHQSNERSLSQLFSEINLNASKKKDFDISNLQQKNCQQDCKQNTLQQSLTTLKQNQTIKKQTTLSTQFSTDQILHEIKIQDTNKQVALKKQSNLVRKFSLIENMELTFPKIQKSEKKLQKSLSKVLFTSSKFSLLQKQNTLL